MSSLKEALVGSREVLLGVPWAAVRVADKVRRRGRYGCMFIQSEASEILVVDMIVG